MLYQPSGHPLAIDTKLTAMSRNTEKSWNRLFNYHKNIEIGLRSSFPDLFFFIFLFFWGIRSLGSYLRGIWLRGIIELDEPDIHPHYDCEIAECVRQDNWVSHAQDRALLGLPCNSVVSRGAHYEFRSKDALRCAVGLWTFLIEIRAYSVFRGVALWSPGNFLWRNQCRRMLGAAIWLRLTFNFKWKLFIFI